MTKALPMEVATVAGEGAFIGGVALTMCAITLVVSILLSRMVLGRGRRGAADEKAAKRAQRSVCVCARRGKKRVKETTHH